MAAVQVAGGERYIGLSTDSKPSAPPAGSTFLESDTGLRYVFGGSAWSVTP